LSQKALTPKNLGKNLRYPTGFTTDYQYVFSFLSFAFPIKENLNLNTYDGGKLKWVDKFAQLETFTAFRMKNASLTQIELETNQI
jgi:hypothetical protein